MPHFVLPSKESTQTRFRDADIALVFGELVAQELPVLDCLSRGNTLGEAPGEIDRPFSKFGFR